MNIFEKPQWHKVKCYFSVFSLFVRSFVTHYDRLKTKQRNLWPRERRVGVTLITLVLLQAPHCNVSHGQTEKTEIPTLTTLSRWGHWWWLKEEKNPAGYEDGDFLRLECLLSGNSSFFLLGPDVVLVVQCEVETGDQQEKVTALWDTTDLEVE